MRVKDLEDDKTYIFKRAHDSGELKGITLKGIFKEDKELDLKEKKDERMPDMQ